MSIEDPFSAEATELLERHRLEALEVAKIKAARDAMERRTRTANRMGKKLATIGQTLYDQGRDSEEIEEEYDHLGRVMHEDGLTAAQRSDIWAWVAATDKMWGWG